MDYVRDFLSVSFRLYDLDSTGFSMSPKSLPASCVNRRRLIMSIHLVSPGLLLTDWAERFSDEQKEAHRQATKLKRVVTVEDVAEQVFTFARSKSTTGVNVVMDAGFNLR